MIKQQGMQTRKLLNPSQTLKGVAEYIKIVDSCLNTKGPVFIAYSELIISLTRYFDNKSQYLEAPTV